MPGKQTARGETEIVTIKYLMTLNFRDATLKFRKFDVAKICMRENLVTIHGYDYEHKRNTNRIQKKFIRSLIYFRF